MAIERDTYIQLLALSTLLSQALARIFKLSGDPNGESKALLEQMDTVMSASTFPNWGPEESDLAAQDLRDEVVRIVLRARAFATGERYDPDSYKGDWRQFFEGDS
jgi:hypothetical protein